MLRKVHGLLKQAIDALVDCSDLQTNRMSRNNSISLQARHRAIENKALHRQA